MIHLQVIKETTGQVENLLIDRIGLMMKAKLREEVTDTLANYRDQSVFDNSTRK